MKSHRTARLTAAAVAALVGCASLATAPAQAAPPNTTPLSSLLTSTAFDSNGDNYDIVTAAVNAVLTANPTSPVAVLTDGTVRLTAFLPNDRAFQQLVALKTGAAVFSESDTFTTIAGLGIPTVEQILQYHVVPGPAITSTQALASDGATLTTALAGGSISVAVSGSTITLGDADPDAANPTVILTQVDLNSPNRQIAHGIDGVLLPLEFVLGTNPLASVLDAVPAFDGDASDFDIVTAAVNAVLTSNPTSPVALLADGTVRLTAFLPTDGAFQALVSRLTNSAPVSEADTFAAVAGLGIPTVETILLYHVVPGGPIRSADALSADGAVLDTAATIMTGEPPMSATATFAVSVSGTTITLTDNDPLSTNPVVNLSQVDINARNRQLAHGIDAVLLPSAVLSPLGSTSLATVLTATTPALDRFGGDYDIVTAAVLTVLAAKPGSPVAALSNGSVALTAFIPNDNAFIKLARTLTKKKVRTEAQALRVIKRLGVSTIEQVLLYHVVVGDPIYSENALAANGASLSTALTGKSIGVRVRGTTITLVDLNSRTNPRVILSQVDINRGNVQVAHGIDRVLIPVKKLRLHRS